MPRILIIDDEDDIREVASLALALASDEHPFMTGAQIVIDGGKTAKAG